MKDLVSVIIPTYNRSNMIDKAIQSCIDQDYFPIEIIVVDDNANNIDERIKTKKIVDKYNNVKLIQNDTNLGGALTRNKGIEMANGKYVAFLDDDDYFTRDKISKQMKLMKELEKQKIEVGMIYCYKYTYDKNNNIGKSRKVNVEGNCLYKHMLNIMETTSTWLCPKEVLIKVGMFENVKAHQDNILLMKILANGYSIYRVPERLLYFYLHNGDGITSSNKAYIDKTKVLIEYKKKYYNLLTNKQIENVEYKNSSILIRLYRINNMKEEYNKEFKKVLKNNKFRWHTIKMYLFRFFMK